jgi:hypothetical protein
LIIAQNLNADLIYHLGTNEITSHRSQ